MTGSAAAGPPDSVRPPERPLLEMLGLAARARGLAHGTDAARGAARDGKAAAVLVAADAAPTQARKLIPLLEARGIPFAVCLTRDEIGAAIGRGPVSAVAITDRNFARRVLELARELSTSQDRGGGELH
jgi:ribosomal protein L7Ae-like RNA K-turn-binding protein